MLGDVVENQIAKLLGLVAEVHHFPISANQIKSKDQSFRLAPVAKLSPANTLEALFTHVNHQRRSANSIVAMSGNIDLHATLRGAVQSVPM